ncbi:GNAT family N-acetyltransferase [Riemerella columbina]|uniref:GNAT family N-acetyltransferase n=1 Tax=Riemerella columbina TaxID=103810 RepID=UPI0026704ACB|nr:GNAT family N-acetyltransferase [Riemerella columbina]WKS96004.1 N-acetyltransferase [Riemerella columbina]
MISFKQTNNEKNGQFEIFFDGHPAGLMTYTWAGADKFIIDHTEISEAYNGKGFGKELVLQAVDFARKEGVKIIPLCPFAKATFQKTEEIRDVL